MRSVQIWASFIIQTTALIRFGQIYKLVAVSLSNSRDVDRKFMYGLQSAGEKAFWRADAVAKEKIYHVTFESESANVVKGIKEGEQKDRGLELKANHGTH